MDGGCVGDAAPGRRPAMGLLAACALLLIHAAGCSSQTRDQADGGGGAGGVNVAGDGGGGLPPTTATLYYTDPARGGGIFRSDASGRNSTMIVALGGQNADTITTDDNYLYYS